LLEVACIEALIGILLAYASPLVCLTHDELPLRQILFDELELDRAAVQDLRYVASREYPLLADGFETAGCGSGALPLGTRSRGVSVSRLRRAGGPLPTSLRDRDVQYQRWSN